MQMALEQITFHCANTFCFLHHDFYEILNNQALEFQFVLILTYV